MRIDPQRLRSAWGEFLGGDDAFQFAVSAAYNPHFLGTAGRCYRITSDGECLPLRGSGVAARYGINRIAGARYIPLEQVHRDFDRLHGRVDRKLFGTKFNALPEMSRSAFRGMIENPRTNLHVHLCWRVPHARADQFPAAISAAWRAIAPAATIDVQPIRDEGWGHYIAKDQGDEAALFLASRPARS